MPISNFKMPPGLLLQMNFQGILTSLNGQFCRLLGWNQKFRFWVQKHTLSMFLKCYILLFSLSLSLLKLNIFCFCLFLLSHLSSIIIIDTASVGRGCKALGCYYTQRHKTSLGPRNDLLVTQSLWARPHSNIGVALEDKQLKETTVCIFKSIFSIMWSVLFHHSHNYLYGFLKVLSLKSSWLQLFFLRYGQQRHILDTKDKGKTQKYVIHFFLNVTLKELKMMH